MSRNADVVIEVVMMMGNVSVVAEECRGYICAVKSSSTPPYCFRFCAAPKRGWHAAGKAGAEPSIRIAALQAFQRFGTDLRPSQKPTAGGLTRSAFLHTTVIK